MKMKTLTKLLLLLVLFSGIIVGCKEDPIPEPGKEEASALTKKINGFIKDVMIDYYLWYKEMPDIDTRYEFDSKAYFEKLLYVDDKFSLITDDIQSWENSVEGIEKSYGWSLTLGRFTDNSGAPTGTFFALVEFVYPETPAAIAGAKRGDMIYEINGADITENNYMDLFNSDNLSFTFGQYTESGISNGKTASMTSLELNLNPVLFTNIIEHEGHKIGYLFYAQFIDKYNDNLDTVFQYFQEQQITDLVLDLRYNGGGTSPATQQLCSSIAPVNEVNKNNVIVTYQWNDKLQEYFSSNGIMNNLELRFINTVPTKLGLSKIHILTGQGTASASELLITGLKAYMDVVTIGETTSGKYLGGSISWKPEDMYDNSSYYSDFDNWGLYIMMFRFANSQGVTDFKDGFAPDIPIIEDLFSPAQLGNKQEALLKAAIEDITGTEVLADKSAVIRPQYEIIDRGFSKYDAIKNQFIIKDIDKSVLRK